VDHTLDLVFPAVPPLNPRGVKEERSPPSCGVGGDGGRPSVRGM
jgi:hypothetical protein